ncbi:putative ribonuclease H-like domain-containing protein, partial [Tanacetum coccineum]
LLIYPSWASDELLYLTSSRFNELACCIEECIEAYFSIDCHSEVYVNSCKSVLHSESSDESLEPSDFRVPQETQPSSSKDKGKGIMIKLEVPLKRKDQIALDEQIARDIQAKLDVKLLEEQKLARKQEEEANIEREELIDEEKAKLFMELIKKRRKHFAALRAQEKRNRPPTKEQNRTQMSTYLKHMGKQRKVEEEKESEEVEKDDEVELKKLLVIKKDEDIAIDAIPLATKLPVIIDYKLHKEGMLVHYELIRADGSSKRYSSMIKMIQGIDREDLEALWRIVKAKYGNTMPKDDFERVLYGDLRVMFEPDIKSNVWRMLRVKSSEDQKSLGAPEDASKQGRSIEDIDDNVDYYCKSVTTLSVDDIAVPTTIEELTLGSETYTAKASKPKLLLYSCYNSQQLQDPRIGGGGLYRRPRKQNKTRKKVDEEQLKAADEKCLKERAGKEQQRILKETKILDDGEKHVEAKVDMEILTEEQKLARKQEEEANIALIEEELTDEKKAKLFMELMEKRRKHFAALRAQEKRNRPPTKAQKRNQMSTYLKHMGSEVQESKEKKEEVEEVKESEEVDKVDEAGLKKLLVIKKDEDIAIDAIPLATKLPVIIDYKLHKEGMLAKYGDTKPKNEFERVLYGDLKVMFEPDIKMIYGECCKDTGRFKSSEDQKSLGAPEDASKQGRSIEDIDDKSWVGELEQAHYTTYPLRSEMHIPVPHPN